MSKEAQSSDIKSWVRSFFLNESGAVFFLDRHQFFLFVNNNGWSGANLVDGREHYTGFKPTFEEALEFLVNEVGNIAMVKGYANPEARTIGDLSIDNQVRREGFVTSGGYNYFIRGPIPASRGTTGKYVIERAPSRIDGAGLSGPVVSMGDAEIFQDVAFTRIEDAQTYLVFGEYERLWNENNIQRSTSRETLAIINRIRENLSLPNGTVILSGSGWHQMTPADKTFLVEDNNEREYLNSIGIDLIALVFKTPQSNDQMNIWKDGIRSNLGFYSGNIDDQLLLISTRMSNQDSNLNREPPSDPPGDPPKPSSRYQVNTLDLLDAVEMPQTEEDDFDVILASASRQRRKRVISFDYDSTTVLPDIDPATGMCEYDEDNEPVSTLNTVAADLMKRHKANGDEIVIVTARSPNVIDSVWRTIRENDLPVSEVYATNHSSKVPILKEIGAAIHYDDSPFHIEDIQRELGSHIKAYYDTDMERHLEEGES